MRLQELITLVAPAKKFSFGYQLKVIETERDDVLHFLKNGRFKVFCNKNEKPVQID